MAEVTVTIAGRNYRMACDDGQEDHLHKLGDLVDRKIADMRSSFGEIGDMRLTVMAGIVIADELAEARRKIGELDEKIELLRKADAKGVVAFEHDTAQAVEVVDRMSG